MQYRPVWSMVFAGLCNAQTMYMGPAQLYRLNLIFWIVMGLILASFNCMVTLKVYSTYWRGCFSGSDSTPGVLVSRGQLAKCLLGAPPEKVPLNWILRSCRFKKFIFRFLWEWINNQIDHCSGTTGQVTHIAVTNGPLTVCHPSLGNSQTPRPHTVAHYPKKFLEISWKASRIGQMMIGRKSFTARVKPFF